MPGSKQGSVLPCQCCWLLAAWSLKPPHLGLGGALFPVHRPSLECPPWCSGHTHKLPQYSSKCCGRLLTKFSALQDLHARRVHMQNGKQLTSLRMGACELVRTASAPAPRADHFDFSKFSLWGEVLPCSACHRTLHRIWVRKPQTPTVQQAHKTQG